MKHFALLLLIMAAACQKPQKPYQRLTGHALGTTFSIIYSDPEERNFEEEVDALIHAMNKSLSTYMPESDISKINNGDLSVEIDTFFKEVFQKSKTIHQQTEGSFDPTIGIMVNAWGFGPENELEDLDSTQVHLLMRNVGFDKIYLKGNRLETNQDSIYLDFNAIAKGFTVDVVGRFLESEHINNYLVEIGGEVRTRGVNEKGEYWKIGIEKPNFDDTRSFQGMVSLQNESIATSGNYRKYKIDKHTGNRFAHTIDTRTGYPSKSDLLSASVIADLDCADVDAYATAFMAMGFQKTKEFLKENPSLKVYLIYDDNGNIKTFHTDNLNIQENQY